MMEIINYEAIEKFKKKYADSRGPLNSWIDIVNGQEWQSPDDVKKTFNTVSFVGHCAVFNIKGNHYRLIADINYKTQQVYINAVLTHSEYDKAKWKSDC